MRLDAWDRALLNEIQLNFPLGARPFAELAARLGADEGRVLRSLRLLKEAGIIRRLGGIFDSRRLGYWGTLGALKVPPGRIAEVAAVVNSYEAVTHNYLREHEYNMWFTVLTETQAAGLAILEEIAARTGIPDLLNLPALRFFKIYVYFDCLDGQAGPGPAPAVGVYDVSAIRARPLDPAEKALVRRLQQGLPLVPRPYAALGREVGYSEEEVLRKVADFLATGVLRRLGAALKHQRVGYVANAMIVWQVPEETLVATGLGLAAFPEVTHCYQRVTTPAWPYNLYTVIHGQSREQALAVASRLAGSAGLEGRYQVLFSTAELKKSSMRYFV